MAVKFDVEGPYEVPRTRRPGGSAIETGNIREFWNKHEHLCDRVGCYIFAMRASRGVLPGYVGKATKGFKQEVFTDHKLAAYQRYMLNTRKGTPVLFFVVAENRRGRVNLNAIADCESELITLASRTNADLENKRGTRGPSFFIPHVTAPTRGRKSKSTQGLLHTLGLEASESRIAEVKGEAAVAEAQAEAESGGEAQQNPSGDNVLTDANSEATP